MKETRTINLNGIVLHIDNDAYQSLSNYFNDIELRLPTDEREDVMTDIEARVCELLQAALFAKNVQVVDITMIENIKTRIGDPEEFGENKRPKVKVRPQAERSGCSRALKITLYVILALIGIQILLPILAIVFAFCLAGLGLGVGAFSALPVVGTPFFGDHLGLALLTIFSAVAAIGLPLAMLIYTIVCWIRNRRGPKARFWLIMILCWLLSVGCFTQVIIKQAGNWYDGDALKGKAAKALTGVDIVNGENPTQFCKMDSLNFNDIRVSGAVNVDVLVSPKYSYSEVLNQSKYVRVEVTDSVLTITGDTVADPIGLQFRQVVVCLPDLKTLNISGASQGKVTGEDDEVHYIVTGASKLDATEAVTQIVHVNCLGASKANVYAEKELWAQANGASKIKYSGNPAVKRKLAVGASKIVKD